MTIAGCSRHPQDPPGLDRMCRTKIVAPEAGDTDIGFDRLRLSIIHGEDAHRAVVDAVPAPVAEELVNEDVDKEIRGIGEHCISLIQGYHSGDKSPPPWMEIPERKRPNAARNLEGNRAGCLGPGYSPASVFRNANENKRPVLSGRGLPSLAKGDGFRAWLIKLAYHRWIEKQRRARVAKPG